MGWGLGLVFSHSYVAVSEHVRSLCNHSNNRYISYIQPIGDRLIADEILGTPATKRWRHRRRCPICNSAMESRDVGCGRATSAEGGECRRREANVGGATDAEYGSMRTGS